MLEDKENKTMAEIAADLGMTVPVARALLGITETQATARDTRISVYNVVGHDGSNSKDICSRCGIIMLHDYSGLPYNWVMDQESVGGVCASCHEYMTSMWPDEMTFLSTCGCAVCGTEHDTKVYFYQSGVAGTMSMYPYRAVPLCQEHQGEIYAEDKRSREIVKHFHDSLPETIAKFLLTGE